MAGAAVILAACADVPARSTAPAADPPGSVSASAATHARLIAAGEEGGVVQIGEAPAALRSRRRPAARADGTIPGSYIVVFRSDVSDVPGRSRRLATEHGGTLRFTYAGALKGFAADLSESAAAALRRAPGVEDVEPDRVIRVQGTQVLDSTGDLWGLDRIDQRARPLSRSYTYAGTGAGVRVYVFDTGLQRTHPEFGTRAMVVSSVFGDDGNDCNGHGTHVAGIVAGRTFGVAKGALVRAVKVLGQDCSDEGGALSGLIAAIDWVRVNRVDPAVANMSFGGPFISGSLIRAVNNLVRSGVFVSVAAGNATDEACLFSPAAARSAFTVAASTDEDYWAPFSNWGACVDGFAPGMRIKSAHLGGRTAVMHGTSMAAPFVAGVAALYKQKYPGATPATITSWLTTNATTGKIRGSPEGTPNLLLFKGTL
jgi:subtilisin family serine protease